MFAQMHNMGAWSFGEIVIAIIVVTAIIAILFVAMKQFQIQIPQFVITVFWILVAAFVCILAVRFLLAM